MADKNKCDDLIKEKQRTEEFKNPIKCIAKDLAALTAANNSGDFGERTNSGT